MSAWSIMIDNPDRCRRFLIVRSDGEYLRCFGGPRDGTPVRFSSFEKAQRKVKDLNKAEAS